MTHIAFFGRAMDVDASHEGMLVLWLEPFQPNDASDNRVTAWRVWRQHFTGLPPASKDCSNGRACADLFRHFQPSERCCATAGAISQAKPRGRNRKATKQSFFVIERQALIRYTHQDPVVSVFRRAGGEEERQSQQEKSGSAKRHARY